MVGRVGGRWSGDAGRVEQPVGQGAAGSGDAREHEVVAPTLGSDVLLERLTVEPLLDGEELALDAALERDEGEALVELAGTQGVELLNWLVARGTLGPAVRQLHANYHIPISNTAAGLMVLEPGR